MTNAMWLRPRPSRGSRRLRLRAAAFLFFAPLAAFALVLVSAAAPVNAQTHRTADPVIHRMWEVGIEQSQTERLAQALMDSIGPRLAGSPELAASQDWLLGVYESWGIPTRKERYGTWAGWRQGALHVDLVAPRVQTLVAELLAWSAGTDGPLEGEVALLPEVATAADPSRWLPSVEGKWVLAFPPEAMCRAPHELGQNARPETVERLSQQREANTELARSLFERLESAGGLPYALASAGALGIVESRWSQGWGSVWVSRAPFDLSVPSVSLSCEDYGLVYRLAMNGQGPRLRIDAETERLGEVPQFNVVAELRGTELPDEYVLLSAHLDSWHHATGATDNGTGTITMLEAMRILKETYPRPRRTILVGHWGAEEMGHIGSSAFREDHPEVVEGLQAVFNQDNGTWRVERIEAQGLLYAGAHIGRWISAVPSEIADHVTLEFPGAQNNTGSDHVDFLCAGAPAFRLQSPYDEYRQYTHHTNLDTYDKIVFDDLKENATLAAMMAYMASEDPERVPRDKSVLPPDPRTGEPREWVRCRPPRRAPAE